MNVLKATRIGGSTMSIRERDKMYRRKSRAAHGIMYRGPALFATRTPVPPSVYEDGTCMSTAVDMTPTPPKGINSNFGSRARVEYDAAVEVARAVCFVCPAASPCREWGITESAAVAGVVGGLTQDQRKRRLAARARNESGPGVG